MIQTLKKPEITDVFLKHFLLVSLIFPSYYSYFDTPYAPDLILANFFVLLYEVALLYQKRCKLSPGALTIGVLLLLGFNAASLYVNVKQLGWYYSQINISISLLLFFCLLGDYEKKDALLDFFLKAIIVTNLLGLIPYVLNYYGLAVSQGYPRFKVMDWEFGERRYNWIYLHKSEYAFMMILFLSLLITHRHRFTQKRSFYLGVAVTVIGVVISNTQTSMIAMVFVFVGLVLDQLRGKPREIRRKYLLCLIPLALAMLLGLLIASRYRDLLSLGARTYIWEGAIHEIRENPYGIGRMAGIRGFEIPVLHWDAFNCHNVFLNFLLQLSIPVGGICVLAFGLLVLCSLWKKPSFLSLGIWLALLIPMNMDWCLLIQQHSIFLFSIYWLFFYPAAGEKNGMKA